LHNGEIDQQIFPRITKAVEHLLVAMPGRLRDDKSDVDRAEISERSID
jgi:hypothetical protein